MTVPHAGTTQISHGPEETMIIAGKILEDLPSSSVLALHGDLGSGKTCFVRGLARALGITQTVSSPTFTIINEYPAPRPLYHMDLYRMADDSDVWSTGLEEYFESPGIVAIEWAERAVDSLPANTWHIYFEAMADPETRSIRVEPC